jgi:hypothetical protein
MVGTAVLVGCRLQLLLCSVACLQLCIFEFHQKLELIGDCVALRPIDDDDDIAIAILARTSARLCYKQGNKLAVLVRPLERDGGRKVCASSAEGATILCQPSHNCVHNCAQTVKYNCAPYSAFCSSDLIKPHVSLNPYFSCGPLHRHQLQARCSQKKPGGHPHFSRGPPVTRMMEESGNFRAANPLNTCNVISPPYPSPQTLSVPVYSAATEAVRSPTLDKTWASHL